MNSLFKEFDMNYGDILDIYNIDDILTELYDIGVEIEYFLLYDNNECPGLNLLTDKPIYNKNDVIFKITFNKLNLNTPDKLIYISSPISKALEYLNKNGFKPIYKLHSDNYIDIKINIDTIEIDKKYEFRVDDILKSNINDEYKRTTVISKPEISLSNKIISFDIRAKDGMYMNNIDSINCLTKYVSLNIIDNFISSNFGDIRIDLHEDYMLTTIYRVYRKDCDKLLFIIRSKKVELPKFKGKYFKKYNNYKIEFEIECYIDIK